jgi:hypothetical protein
MKGDTPKRPYPGGLILGVGRKRHTREFIGDFAAFGGDGGIRTLDRALQPYNGLANRRLQPLGHVSGEADMPDAALSRKRQMLCHAILPVHINYRHEWEAESALLFRPRRTPIGAPAGTRIWPESRGFSRSFANQIGIGRSAAVPCRSGRLATHII